MRILELTFISSIIIIAISLFVIPVKIRFIKYAAFAGILLPASIHLLYEGFRWQMLPAYFLGALTLALLYKISKNPAFFSRRKAKGGFILFLIVWVPLTLLLPLLLPVFNVAAPSGPYPTGRVTFNMEEMDGSGNAEGKTNLHLWYPAKGSGEETALYFPHLNSLEDEMRGNYSVPPFFLSYLAYVKTHSEENVPIAESIEGFPVVLLSTDMNLKGFMYTSLAESLASYGYLVVVIESDALPSKSKENQSAWNDQSVKRSKNASLVLDFLFKANEDHSFFKNKLNLSKIGAIGHGAGGDVAFHSLLKDQRVKAAVSMEGNFLMDRKAIHNQNKPFLYMTTKMPYWKYSGFIASITGTQHSSYSDYYLYSPLLSVLDKVNHREDQKIINDTVVQFLQKCFYSDGNTMFENGKSPYPRLKLSLPYDKN